MAVRSNLRAVLYLAAAVSAMSMAGRGLAQETPTTLSDARLAEIASAPDPRPAVMPRAAVPLSDNLDTGAGGTAPMGAVTPADIAGVTGPSDLGSGTPDSSVYNLKPRPKKSKLYKPNPKGSPPLRALAPYPTAPKPAPYGPGLPDVDPRAPGPTVAALPIPPRPRKPLVDDDPYAPVGIGIGEMRLFPFVEASGGYESNPNTVSGGATKGAPALHGDAGFDLKSNFPTNSLTASFRGGYYDYPGYSDANRPEFNGTIDGRLDVTRSDRIDMEGRFALTTQRPGSTLLAVPGSVNLASRPNIVTEGATLGGTHDFNRLSLSLRGTVDRTAYGDGVQSDGTIARFSQDNYNDYGLIARAAYELTPALSPFTELGFDSRVRDHAIDESGYARNSNGGTAKLGATFEFTRLLTGSASVGYADRHYADPRLVDLRGPTIDGSLAYTVTPLTTATLKANTILTETTLPGATGVIARSLSLEVAHALWRNLTITATGTYQVNQYQGAQVDETYNQADLKATYKLNREVQIFGSLSRQQLVSSVPGSSFKDYIFLAGIRLQR